MFNVKSKPKELRSIRERRGHSLTSLAEASELSKQRIWQLENKPDGLLPPTAKKIADALGVEIEDIATITDEDEAVKA